ncbi:MAG: AsnC family transcriptional regulator [Actinobacteria bacterium]|nr:AsnC family transcriptional regulator [Actinomycetota bacterium]
MDEFDARILRQLEMSGRMSWAELSSQVHLSPTAVADRVRRMERDGVIRGYQANVDPAAYGRTTRAVIEVGLIAGVAMRVRGLGRTRRSRAVAES